MGVPLGVLAVENVIYLSSTQLLLEKIFSVQSQAADRPASPLCTSFDQIDSSMFVALPERTEYCFCAHAAISCRVGYESKVVPVLY
jgi:hypothetical protein